MIAFCSLTAYGYIVGYAQIILDIAETCPNLVPIVPACHSLRFYFRCATRLYRSINEPPKSRQKLADLVSFQCWLLPQTKEKLNQTIGILAVRMVEEEILSCR